METIYSSTKWFGRLLNHILVMGDSEVSNFNSNIVRIEIHVSDRNGSNIGWLVVDTDPNQTITYLKLYNWAAEKYRDLSD